jgi:hypothetical protein
MGKKYISRYCPFKYISNPKTSLQIFFRNIQRQIKCDSLIPILILQNLPLTILIQSVNRKELVDIEPELKVKYKIFRKNKNLYLTKELTFSHIQYHIKDYFRIFNNFLIELVPELFLCRPFKC